MHYIIKSLPKLLTIIVTTCYITCGFSDITQQHEMSTSGSGYIEEFQSPLGRTRGTSARTLCPRGKYVSKCGNYRVGFNWLKKTVLTFINDSTTCGEWSGEWDNENNACVSKNFYYTDDQYYLLQQMRDFFGATSGRSYALKYCTDWDDTNDSCTSTGMTSPGLLPAAILNTFCDPLDLSVTITCANCPNSAVVEASTVDIGTTTNRKLFTWHFHTIADCYINKFEDTTGTYKYVDENSATQNNAAQRCYYSTYNPDMFDVLNGDI